LAPKIIALGTWLVLIFLTGGAVALWRTSFKVSRPAPPEIQVQEISVAFLEREVLFYSSLNPTQQEKFQHSMARFLSRVQITGVSTWVSQEDRWLVAASAVIPIFHFPDWEDYPLDEIMLYPDAINLDFESGAPDSMILGMVGTGKMEGKMALSRKAMLDGFQNKTDKHNTAIHEFLHLMDKADGTIDGLPKILMDKSFALPWLALIRNYVQKIRDGHTDIPEYGGTNLGEFFAVIGEYFFERPDLLKIKHPELYKALHQMFTGNADQQKPL
jgi:hypothetical protein